MTALIPEPAPSLDAILAAPGVVVVPGLLNWLGRSDYQQSIDSGLTESFQDYCNRISEGATS